MQRVYNQVKRIIDNVNFDKIYKGFKKKKIILKINDYIYGNDQSMLNYINNNDYVIYEVNQKEIVIKDIVINVIMKMFDSQYEINTCNQEKIKYLLSKKDSDFYILKYQLNLMMVNILKGNLNVSNEYINLIDERKNTTSIYDLENHIEKNVGIKKYIHLKLLEMFKHEEFLYELRFIVDTLEDPTKLINYINYVEDFSVAYLLVQNKIEDVKINKIPINIDKPLFSFEKLIIQKEKQIKKILMHKMINAKKTHLKGKVVNIDFNNVYVSGDLLYLPNEIVVVYNNKKIIKKGEFILQLNEQLEIIDGYECFSLEKILA